ncbi:TetR/AcrR family transcriptional regulator [Rhizobium vallis]|uniref:TetR/AcrR family transcriptional regulator n=1 Tax=Rhizobium vallis TaxID=634290 RepID=A0A432PIL4_9HYPH|nr:TetR/AcrR family transcriptional regulator [Rhizobium vallis]RUM24144.1 TetR/AcrR family transcriptional regulator [Rhizobium vallis]
MTNDLTEATKKKRIRNPLKTRQHIIDAAIDEFTERGLDGARIDAIAEASQTNKSLIYRYFNSKEELYTASLKDTYEKLRASQRDFDLNDPDPMSSMRRLIESTFDTFAENPRIVRMITHENVLNARFLKEAMDIRSLYVPLLEKMREIVKIGEEIGVFRSNVDLKHLYISISALGYFYFSNMNTLSIVLDKDLSARKAVRVQREQAVEMVLAYLRR